MIKSINYIFTFVLAVLVGTLYFQQFNLDYNERITVLSFDQVLQDEKIMLVLIANPGETGHTAAQFVESAKEVIEHLQLPASLSVSRLSDNQKHSIRYLFLTSDSELISHVHLESNQSLDYVMSQSKWHITNNPEFEDAVLIDYLDKNYYEFDTGWRNEISIFSMNQIDEYLPDKTSQIGFRVLVDDEDIDLAKQTIAAGMSDYIYRVTPEMPIEAAILETNHEVYRTDYLNPSLLEQIISIPYSVLWLSMLCMLFISIYVSIRQSREIMIGYLHGYDIKLIIKKYFMPYMLVSGALFLVVMIGTSFVISNSHGSLYVKYVMELLPFAMMYIGLLVSSFILTYLWVKYRFSAEILKEKRQYKVVYALMALLKCGIILAICIPLLQEWNDVTDRQPYLDLYNNRSDLRKGVSINYSGLNHNVVKERIELVEEVSTWVAQNKIGYVDFNDYMMNYIFDERQNTHMRNPTFMTSNGFTLLKEPYLIVNAKYLYDYTGLEFEATDDVRFVLPEKYGKDSDVYQLIASQIDHDIEFYNEDLVFAPHFETGVEIKPLMGVMINPILIIDAHAVEKSRRFEGNIVAFSDDEPLYEMINEMEDKYPTTFSVQTVESSYQRVNQEQIKSLSTVLQFVLMHIVLLIIFVITTTGVFLTSYANELVVHYMNGYGYIKRYKSVYAITSLVSVLAFGFVMGLLSYTGVLDVASWLGLLIGTIIIDNIVVMSMIHVFERKNMAMILKGDI